jgi:tetraprenyl-beta-curcumene synthase
MGALNAPRQTGALALANLRFWPTVAPAMWRSLEHWRGATAQIDDPALRSMALGKLRREAFNAEVAATLATLAPSRQRQRTTEAIVALEVLFDYLDGRTEQLTEADDPTAEALRLFGAMTGSLRADAAGWKPSERDGDGRYMAGLRDHVQDRVERLPSFDAVRDRALAAAVRCAEAQSRLHACARLGDRQLESWAREHCPGSGLEWRDYVGGCASSVLAVHALIAAGASPDVTKLEASAIDDAYLAIGALITMLDSTVDESEDLALGQPGYMRLFAQSERGEHARALARLALDRCWQAPEAAHHAMTLGGVVAYYTSHPGARAATARPVVAAVRAELGKAVWPALAVMLGWRAAKSGRSRTGRT